MSCRRLATASLMVALLIVACSVPTPLPASDDAVVYVIDRGWHTDIGLPVQEISAPLATLEAVFPGVRFLTFGFGDRQFLMDRRRTFGAMLNALLPSRGALLMTALRAAPSAAFGEPHVVVLHVSRNGLDRIEASLWHELELAPSGQPMLLANGPYSGSVFYAARDTYSGLFTCNTWAAETLRTGGLPVPATGVLFSGQVMGMARWISTRQALSPKT